MNVKKYFSYKSFLILTNVCLTSFVLFLLLHSFNEKGMYNEIEAQKITIRSPKGSSYIEMKIVDQNPYICMYEDTDKPTMEMTGGNFPSIALRNKKGIMTAKMHIMKNGSSEISLLDSKGKEEIVVQGGDHPGMYLKDFNKRTIGSWTTLIDGGTGIGLAYKDGNASTIIRGGTRPGVAFFSKGDEPSAAIGIVQDIPHLLISGQEKNEGVLIHGGNPTGVLVVDEEGKLKILISKHGVFQGKDKEEMPEKSDRKLFSLGKDKDKLFPDDKKLY